MPASPWKRLDETEPDREYLAIVTFLPLERYHDIPEFLRTTRTVTEQLEGSYGAVGYSVSTHLTRKQFWTLSVWLDAASLTAFARGEPHRGVMRRYRAEQPGFRSARWTVAAADLPPKWRDARSRLQVAGDSNGSSAG